MMQGIPRIAIIDPNTLAVLGLKGILEEMVPILTVEAFGSFKEFLANKPDEFVHYFVAMNIVLDNRSFFLEHRRKTVVLTISLESTMADFHCLCTNVPEKQLIHAILQMIQGAHPHGRNMPQMPKALQQKILSDREQEVMALIVQGYINKEIADKLHIGLATVITHRRNIMEKLGVRSVSALTIYAVMHGYVDINKI